MTTDKNTSLNMPLGNSAQTWCYDPGFGLIAHNGKRKKFFSRNITSKDVMVDMIVDTRQGILTFSSDGVTEIAFKDI